MPRAAAVRPNGRIWLWPALLLSAVLHAAVAAVLWRTEPPYSTTPDTRTAMFELVHTGSNAASTSEPPRHDSTAQSPETASAPPANPAANDAPLPLPQQAPAPVPTPNRPPVDSKASLSRATKPAPKTSQQPAHQVAPKPHRSGQTNKPKEQPSRRPQPERSAATGSTTAPTPAGNAGTPASQGRTQMTRPGESDAVLAAERAYLTALQRAIARHQRYPAGARRHGQTGVATLSLVIEADGRIGQIRLAQSSGHASLDQAALQALARLGRFDPIPKSIGRSRWSLRIPIRFDLK